jgi:hypothetical protein
VCYDVHDSPKNDGPSCSLVKSDVLVEGNDLIERGAAEHGDEVAADREENKYHIHVKNQSSHTSDGWKDISRRKTRVRKALTVSNSKRSAGGNVVVLELVVGKAKDRNKKLQEDPDNEEDALSTLINHPSIPFVGQSGGFLDNLCALGEIRSHKTLEPPALRLVALEMRGDSIWVYDNVRVIKLGSSI